MEARTLSAAGFAVGTLALVLAVVALLTRPEGADDPREELAAVRGEVSALNEKLAAASVAEASASAREAELSGRVTELERAVAEFGELGRAEAAEVPADQAVPAEVDEERLRELISEVAREEMRNGVREVMDRFRGGRGGPGMDADGLREQLGLEAEQAEKVAEFGRRMNEEIRNIWQENRGGGRDQNRELMDELRQKTEEEIGKLLTPEQMERYRAMRDERGRRGWGRRRGRPRDGDRPGGEPDRQPPADAPVF
jgi:hypothetical protein